SQVIAPEAIPVGPLPTAVPVPEPEQPLPLWLRLFFNPAPWLIGAALVGLALLGWAIVEREKVGRQGPPPIQRPAIGRRGMLSRAFCTKAGLGSKGPRKHATHRPFAQGVS